MTKITIIETGLPPKDIRADWPTYPAMFEALLSQVDNSFTYETVSVVEGAPLPDPAALEGILHTGSAYGVYDNVAWMPALMTFIRGAADAATPQFGICFGHQAMAQALGGTVLKSDKGWGVGRHTYTTPHRPAWMASGPEHFSIAVSHQDQVVAAPEGAQITAQSDFCKYAGLAYAGSPSASFQGHPEFSADFSSTLHQLRRDRIGGELVDEAVASFDAPLDSLHVAKWMADFFRSAQKA
jgi:GMP synthase-like glutamine amidotransferase